MTYLKERDTIINAVENEYFKHKLSFTESFRKVYKEAFQLGVIHERKRIAEEYGPHKIET